MSPSANGLNAGNLLLRPLSRIPSRSTRPATPEVLERFRRAQRLAYDCAVDVSGELREGMTEQEAAALLESRLRDSGVRGLFHRCFAWFGDRTRFGGFRGYRDFLPSERRLKPGEAVILDVAPIVEGVAADIGYSCSLGPNPDLERAMRFLRELRDTIPALFANAGRPHGVWREVDARIRKAGFENCHEKYPFSVLGHRVRPVPFGNRRLFTVPAGVLSWFSGHSYWAFLSRAILPELLGPYHGGKLTGVWAVEPHVGTPAPSDAETASATGSLKSRLRRGRNPAGGFGAKFEEILVVDQNGARWLDEDVPHMRTPSAGRHAP